MSNEQTPNVQVQNTNQQAVKRIFLPPEFKLVPYILAGFSFSQVLGILATGFGFYQVYVLVLILIIILMIPGALTVAGVQSKSEKLLPRFRKNSFYVPSMIAVTILIIGFSVGYWVGAA